MHTLSAGTRGLRLLAHLSMDRFLMAGTLGIALGVAAYLAQHV